MYVILCNWSQQNKNRTPEYYQACFVSSQGYLWPLINYVSPNFGQLVFGSSVFPNNAWLLMRLFLKSYNTDGKRNHMYKDFKVFNGKNIVIVIYVNTKSWIFFLNMKFCKINKWKLITVSDNVVLSTKFTLDGAICDDAYLNIIWFTSLKHLLGQAMYIVMFAYMFFYFFYHCHSICIYGCSECKYKVYWIYIFNWWLSGLTEQFLSTIRPLIDKSDVWVAYRPNTSVPILHVYPILSSPGSIVSSLTKDIYCNK